MRYLTSQHCRKFSRKFSASIPEYDVIIGGGGVVGAAFAANLLKSTKGECKIAVIEPSRIPELRLEKSVPDSRVYALSPKSIDFLRSIDAWNHIEKRSHAYAGMQIWESNGHGVVRFNAEDCGKLELGRICEDSTIQSAIYKAIENLGYKLDFFQDRIVSDVTVPPLENFANGLGKVVVSSRGGNEGKEILARLIVGADGAQSSIRRQCGIPQFGWGYGQEGLVATVKVQESFIEKNCVAWQKYLSTGPVALLPLWDGHCSIVWSANVNEIRRLKALSNEAFLRELNDVLQRPAHTDKWSILGKTDGASVPNWVHAACRPLEEAANRFSGLHRSGESLNLAQRLKREAASVLDAAMSASLSSVPFAPPPRLDAVCSKRLCFPLSFQQASTYVSPRVALVGDAAHSIHPQAGQGLNLGLLDAESLSTVVSSVMSAGGDIGNVQELLHYHNDRFPKNLVMMSTVDAIHRMFDDSAQWDTNRSAIGSNDAIPPTNRLQKFKQLLRSMGMLSLNSLGPVKGKIAEFAMGLSNPR